MNSESCHKNVEKNFKLKEQSKAAIVDLFRVVKMPLKTTSFQLHCSLKLKNSKNAADSQKGPSLSDGDVMWLTASMKSEI